MLRMSEGGGALEVQERTLQPVHQGRWTVIIFHSEVTPYDDVLFALIRATNCTVEEATLEAWEAHHFGSAHVHFDTQEECEAAARVMESIGVLTKVCREWED